MMRRILPAIWIGTLLAVAGPVGAATVLVDPQGDVAVSPPFPSMGFEHIDLLALEVAEDPEGFLITVSISSTSSSTDEVRVRGASLVVPVVVGSVEYAIEFQRDSGTFLQHKVLLHGPSPEGGTEVLYIANNWESDQPKVDHGSGSISAFIPRTLLRDERGHAPTPNDELIVGPVTASSHVLGGFATISGPLESEGQAFDAMPDDLTMATVPVMYGVPSQGVEIESMRPFRVSNGEATTHLFEFNITNEGAPGAFILDAIDVPPSWGIHVTPSAMDLGGGETRTVGVLATVPFAHVHGLTDWGTLVVMDSDGGEIRGGQHFGVRYLETPRPAGHHDTLFIHARQVGMGAEYEVNQAIIPNDSGLPGFLSTVLEDAASTGEGLVGQPMFLYAGEAPEMVRWKIVLSPLLDIGLDVNQDHEGSFAASIRVPTGVFSGTLHGRISVVGGFGDDETRSDAPFGGRPVLDLAHLETVEVDISDQAALIEARVIPVPGVERVPLVEDTNLVLDLWLLLDAPSPQLTESVPRIDSGAFVRVPLDEYQDIAEDLFHTGTGAPTVRLDQGAVLRAEPGATLEWSGTYSPPTARISLAGPGSFALDETQSGRLRAIVQVPEEAALGDLLVAYVVADAGDYQTAQRISVLVVDTNPDLDAYAKNLDPAHGATGLGIPALLLALAGALLFFRRNRN